jgi:hypothetical protein
MTRAKATAASCAVLLAACGLTVSGAGVGAPGGDAGADVVDGSIAEGAPGDDASVGFDSGDDVAPTDFCAAKHDLCDDFEQGLGSGRWGSSATQNGGSLTLTPAAKQGTSALEVALPANDILAPTAKLVKLIGKAATRVVCELDVFPAQRDTSLNAYVNALWINVSPVVTENDLVAISLHAAPALDTVYETGLSGFAQHTIPTIAAGGWRHVKIDLNLAASTVDVAIDGSPTHVSGLSTPTSATSVRISLGAPDSSSPVGWTMRYDDVFCDLL